MPSFVNAVVFNAASGGTGTFTVSSAVTGWLTPAQAGASDGASYRYRAYSSDNTQWEVGTGTYTASGTTLTRTVTFSSNSNNAVNFTTAPQVALTSFAEDMGLRGGAGNGVFYENPQTVTASYTINSSYSAMSTGPITINAGVTVTVPSGSRWVVI